MAQPEGPRDEVADELQVRRVLGHAQHPHTVEPVQRRRVGLGVGACGVARDDHDVVARVRERRGQRVHVASEPADHHGRVLPRQHQHPHARPLTSPE